MVAVRVTVFGAVLLYSLGARAGTTSTTTVVLMPQYSEAALAPLAGAVERLVRAEVDRTPGVTPAPAPSLDVPALFLAVGCVGETPECHRAVAEQLGVRWLVLSRLDSAGEAAVLSVWRFDAEHPAVAQPEVARAEGPQREVALLEQIPGIVRRIHGLNLVAPAEEAALVRSPPPWVWGLLGTGAAALAVGTVLGLLAESTESDFRSAPRDTEAQVDAALDLEAKARRQSLGANLSFALGGAALAGGVVAWILAPQELTVVPTAEPGGVGVWVTGRLP